MNKFAILSTRFVPESLALIARGTSLSFRLQRSTSVDDGLLWAAICSVEEGHANCPALMGLKSHAMEATLQKHVVGFPDSRSTSQIELLHSHNPPLAYTAFEADLPLPLDGPLSPSDLLRHTISAFGFLHGINRPLVEAGLNVRQVAEALQNFGFVGDQQLRDKGIISDARRHLAERSAECAGIIDSWLITELCVRMAAIDLNLSLEPPVATDVVTSEWRRRVSHTRGGPMQRFSFSGPRPWSYWAGRLLSFDTEKIKGDKGG
jgi:hypothetical protein